MKLQIDTEAKTIIIEETVEVRKLLSFLEVMLPDAKDYVLIPNVINAWNTPIIIKDYRPWWESPWWVQPLITYTNDTDRFRYFNNSNDTIGDDIKVQSFNGTYNVQL